MSEVVTPSGDVYVDVVVVGSGFAGLAAALAAEEQGASVLVIEGEPRPGGASQYAGGHLMGAGTRSQREQGIDDDPEAFYRYYMALNGWELEPGLVRAFTQGAGPVIDWLLDLGLEIKPDLLSAGEEGVPRMHQTVGEGRALHELLLRTVRRSRIDLLVGTTVTELLLEGETVSGVVASGEHIRASAVVLATGGFGANRELVSEHLPEFDDVGDWFWYIGPRSSQGSAFALVDPLPVQISRGGIAARLLTPNFGPMLEGGYLPGWLAIVNADGQRFYDETSSYSVTQPIVAAQRGPVWAVFDDGARRFAQRHNAEASKRIVIEDRIDRAKKWTQAMIDEMVDRGVVVRADTLVALASEIGVSAENLVGTIQRYNNDLREGEDSLFLKRRDLAREIVEPPFYATEMRLAHLTVTGVGPRIDARARVLDRGSRPIPGLYAAGECTGGLIGRAYLGSGNSIMNCLIFGRIAGAHAARCDAGQEVAQPCTTQDRW